MKKLLLTALIILSLCAPVFGEAPDWSKPSDTKTADAAITTGPGYFYGILVMTDATNACTVVAYDNASAASGTTLFPSWVVTTSTTDRAQYLSFRHPVKYLNGIYVDITCSGTCSYKVYYNN